MSIFRLTKGRFAAAVLACAFGAAIFVRIVGVFELGLVDHRLLSLDEQQLVVGGQNQANSQCGACPATSDCSSANDTQCDAANACAVPNSGCGEVYNGSDPERCVNGKQICNDSDAQHPFVLCYSTWECSCTFDKVNNVFTCDQEQGGQPDDRPNCQIVPQGS